MKVVCFGDSNTWGYDPRDFFGSPYDVTWPELLQRKTGWNVCNWGENGREIPTKPVLFPADTDLLIVMLGTNDLLQGRDSAEIRRRMEQFLESLSETRSKILLIAPPPLRYGTWVTDSGMLRESEILADSFRALAQQSGIRFADAGEWDLELAFDGVHLTQQGHIRFADEILKFWNDEKVRESRY